MPGMTDYTAQALLNGITGKAAWPATVSGYIALFTAVGTDAGTGFTEAAYTGYARVAAAAAAWNAASGTAPSTISSASAITFPTCTALPGAPIIAWGIYDAPTAGNLLWWDFLYAVSGATAAQQAWKPFTCTAAGSGAGSVLSVPAHSFSNGDTVYVAPEFGGTLPTFTQSNMTGPLVVASAATDTFTLTNGGSALWTSSSGSGLIRKMVPQAMVANIQPQIPAGAIVLSAA